MDQNFSVGEGAVQPHKFVHQYGARLEIQRGFAWVDGRDRMQDCFGFGVRVGEDVGALPGLRTIQNIRYRTRSIWAGLKGY
jgi:hypothetical protein